MAVTLYPSTATGGAINTKGAYTEIVAATPAASSQVSLVFHQINAVRSTALLDLATGAAAAESVVVANIAIGSDADAIVGGVLPLEVDLPAGTRLAARSQASSGAGAVVAFTLQLTDRALGSLAAPVTYGANTSGSRGTQVDPGTTINTKGAYLQLTASTTARIDALVLAFQAAQPGLAIPSYTTWSVDLATGAAAAETIVIPNIRLDANVATDCVRPGFVRVDGLSIPAGTRLAVRCACTFAGSPERLLCVSAIGLQVPAAGGAATTVAHAYVG